MTPDLTTLITHLFGVLLIACLAEEWVRYRRERRNEKRKSSH